MDTVRQSMHPAPAGAADAVASPFAAGLPLRSTVAGVAWPAFPDPAGAALLAMLWQLERSERLPVNRLRALQMVQARALLRHAATHVPFYRQLWQGVGFDPSVAALTPKRFAALPVVTRTMLQQAGTAAFSREVPQGHGTIHAGLTPGATGQPLHFRATGLTQFMWRAFTLRDHLWHRRDLSGKLAAIRQLPAGRAEEANWDLATAGLCATGPAVGLDIAHGIVDQAAWLIEQDPHSLITYPGNLYALAGWFTGHGVCLPQLRDVRTMSGVVTPELRAACRAAFGVSLVDSYSTRALGYLALQCPMHEHYHVQEESVLLELLDEHDAPVPPGAMGRVVVTSLLNFAMPFVRYDTGDLATAAAAACACGRSLRVLARIDGRARNLMQLPGGERRWPRCEPADFDAVPGIAQCQLVQTAIDAIEVRLVAGPGFDPEQQPRLAELIHERLGYPFALHFVQVASIPGSDAGRHEQFINRMQA